MEKKYSILVIVMLFISSCGTKVPMTAEVTYKNYTNEIMNVDVIGYGSKKEDALENAQKTAMDIVLFRGIPNSNLKSPHIGINESEIKAKNKKYFDVFYGQKRFLSFITYSVTKIPVQKLENNKKGVAANVKINIMSLRKDLEENGIIRKFGY